MNKGKISLQRENSFHYAGYCMINGSLPALTSHLSLLHPEELAYYHTLKFDKRRTSYLLGRTAAKHALQTLTGTINLSSIAISAGVFLFPVVKYWPQGNMQVSISHCDEFGIALSHPEEHPLGVDIERLDKTAIAALEDQLTAAELRLAGGPLGYTIVWTIKEALSKILRTGLTIDMKLLEIKSLLKEEELYVSEFRHLIQYKAVSCVAGNYVCTVVLPGRTTANLEQFWDDFKRMAAQQP